MMGKYIDIHIHMIPGMDDGPKSPDQSFQMLKQAQENQVGAIVATTHYCPFRWKWDGERYEEGFRLVRTEAEKLGISLYRGNEIYYHNNALDALDSGVCQTLAGSRYALVEFPYEIMEMDLENAVLSFLHNGYRPVIAHGERYECMVRSRELARELTSRGAVLQVNGGSIIRAYQGFLGKSVVKRWLKEKLIHVVGSDAHNTKSRKNNLAECAQVLEKRCGAVYMKELLYGNARRILEGQEL